jgi:hypothetical protein
MSARCGAANSGAGASKAASASSPTHKRAAHNSRSNGAVAFPCRAGIAKPGITFGRITAFELLHWVALSFITDAANKGLPFLAHTHGSQKTTFLPEKNCRLTHFFCWHRDCVISQKILPIERLKSGIGNKPHFLGHQFFKVFNRYFLLIGCPCLTFHENVDNNNFLI